MVSIRVSVVSSPVKRLMLVCGLGLDLILAHDLFIGFV